MIEYISTLFKRAYFAYHLLNFFIQKMFFTFAAFKSLGKFAALMNVLTIIFKAKN